MSRGPSHQPPPNATASSQHRKPSEPRGAPHHLAQESFLASGSSAAASQHRKLSSDPRGAPHHPAQEPFLASSSAASQPRRPSDPRSAPQSREQFLASSAATLAGASQHRKSSTEQRGASQSQEHRRPSDPRGPPQSREQFQAGSSSSSAAAASQHRKLSSEQRGGAPPYYSQEQFQASTSSAAAYSQYRRPSDPRAPPFSEEEFLSVSRELAKSRAKPDAPWHLLYEAMGLSIYRLHDEKTGLYEYKLYGVIVDCSPEQLAEVYMDLQYRTKWDRYCKELNEKTCDGRTAIYWQAKFPFPLANRDYVFTRELRVIEVDGRKIYVVLSKSVATSKFPEKPGIIRVKNYKQCVAIESDGKKGSRDSST
ncbi:phosphatidylcholine transfer protein isoform X2 [Hemicordylus capensis]|uniref:phosphatidylcholine transfer protein isoform X2 n=1 Tax=Hemicordylus capensis TaxID=884348 RepID=UPI00230340ED|nr:phosphatidylcholine transfer protein isoform X2 [Hemicordylus capensis]